MTITAERVRQVLFYEPETGVFRRRRKDQSGFLDRDPRKLDKNGYFVVSIDYKTYAASRLAWLYVTGRPPEGLIDHINGNQQDDRFRNLRDVDEFTNAQNRHGACRNRVVQLPLGVYPAASGRFRSSIMIEGMKCSLGTFDTPEEAHAMYLQTRRLFVPGNTL